MSFLTRLLGLEKGTSAPPVPNETVMKNMMEDAKKKNREAAELLSTATDRHIRDVELVKQVVHDLLDRIDNRKPKPVRRKAS